jgi:dipeptidyl-peptidase-4
MTRRVFPSAIFVLAFLGILTQNYAIAQEKKLPTFEQLFNNAEPRLIQRLPNITGWADDTHYLEMKRKEGDERPKLYAVDVKTGEEKAYRDLSGFRDLVGKGIELASPSSANESRTRLIYQKDKDLYFLNVSTKEFKRLTETPEEEKNPTLAPDGGAVAYTRGNDLYSIDLATGKETRYTSDGGEVVYNGWASWLYYEEILGRPSRYRAFWWSPDSKRIVFFRFDDTRVPEFPIYSSEGQHGLLEKERYPKAGDPNPAVRIGVVTSGDPRPPVWAAFDEAVDQYFGTPFWTPDGNQVLVQWMNRGEDTLKLFGINPKTGARKEIYAEHQPSWVGWFESIKFIGTSGDFILKSDRDGWAHLYRYSASGTLKNRLTSGEWAVSSVELVDAAKGVVYFTGKKESSTRTDLYRVGVDGKGLKRLTFGEYTHTVTLSPGGSYFVTRYGNLVTPMRAGVYAVSGTLIKDLGDSRTKEFDNYALAKTELVRVATPDGYALPMTITLPANLQPGKRYPVLISIYGGPGAGTVSERWGGLSSQWWAQEGIIQVAVDHRGSGHFGKTGEALMHRNLGKWEMNDYIEAVKWLRAKPYVDSTKVCITGGSYGGYVTAMALTYGADYFTHGIASLSVTDWQLYDSHYVERYMDTPAENPEGYKFGSVMTHAGKYRGLLRIIHGTMDDNVHMQNSLQLVDTLESLGKHFELMLYPGGRHGWGGSKAVHLRNETYRFYYEQLLAKPFPENLFANLRPQMGRGGEGY